MTVYDINIGDILTSGGKDFQVQDVTILDNDDCDEKDILFALDFEVAGESKRFNPACSTEYSYRWTGRIKDLYKTFSRINGKEFTIPIEYIDERLESMEKKLDKLTKEMQNLKDLAVLK